MSFEPYFLFRILLMFLFSAYIIYAVLDIVFWFKGLPPLFKKYILLSLINLRFSTVKAEFLIVFFLFLILIPLLWLNIRTVF